MTLLVDLYRRVTAGVGAAIRANVTDAEVRRAYLVLLGWEQTKEEDIHSDHWKGERFQRVRLMLEDFAARRAKETTELSELPLDSAERASPSEGPRTSSAAGPETPRSEGRE